MHTFIGNFIEIAKWLKEIAIQLQITNRMLAGKIHSTDYYNKCRADAEYEVYDKVD